MRTIKKININKIKFSIITLFALFLASCSGRTIKIYHNDTSKVDDGGICGGCLKAFFNKNNLYIKNVNVKSLTLKNQILLIQKKIILTQSNIEPDDSYYEYVLIHKKDTLFSDSRLEFWRYKNFGVYYKPDNKIKKVIQKNF
ncbi:hypothetical protein M2373_004379 [Chryseobacterium sp. JUb7]|nr:hypothetical protein [Chryseobacterium sp. JUb7]